MPSLLAKFRFSAQRALVNKLIREGFIRDGNEGKGETRFTLIQPQKQGRIHYKYVSIIDHDDHVSVYQWNNNGTGTYIAHIRDIKTRSDFKEFVSQNI